MFAYFVQEYNNKTNYCGLPKLSIIVLWEVNMNKLIYVGIDIAKTNHYATFANSNSEVLIKSFKFTNDLAGFLILENKLKLYAKKDIIIGFESTAHYANSLMLYLFNKGYD